MQQECQRSPESCIYSVGVVGEGNRIHQHGTLEVTPAQLIYTPEGEQDGYIWPLRFLKKYSSESDRFTIETGTQCPSGGGMYTFSTKHSTELLRVVARNTTNIVTSPKHIRKPADSQTTPTPSPTFAPPSPSMTSSPYFQRCNGVASLRSPSPQSPHSNRGSRSSLSPTASPVLSRSPSVRSLPENAFEVKNIGEDRSVSQDGVLEVTCQELIYTETTSQQRRVWPLMFLRRYGCSGDVFSIEAGRRCPGGQGFYAFSTPRIAELYELVQSYAKNFYGSQTSLCSVDYSSSIASPPGQLYASQTQTPNPGTSAGGRSESPVFQRSDSFIRRAFSAMELRKNVFEVHNLGDNQEVLGKGTLEVSNTDLIYIDAATGVRWRWPIKYLRRYGCNGVRVFSFEAGRRCPGGPGVYAFETSRANEIHEAIIENINGSNGNQLQMGNLSMSRLSLADTGSQGLRNGRPRKTSVPVVPSANHAHFLTPPPMRKPSQPTLDEIPSSHPRTSTPTRQTSVSSDDMDTIEGGSQSSGTMSPPPTERMQENRSLPPSNRHPVQHTYDIPLEVREQFLRQNSNESKSNDQVKPEPKKRKPKPMVPPPYKPGSGKKISQLSQTQHPAPPSGTQELKNGHTDYVSDSHSTHPIPVPASSPLAQHQDESFYQNVFIRSKTGESPRLSSSVQDDDNGSAVPQPSEGSSLYENLSRYQGPDTPPSTRSQAMDSTSSSGGALYANLADFSAELESGRSNSTPSSPSTITSTSYTEVEIVDMPHPPVTSPDSSAWSPLSPIKVPGDKALNNSNTNSGRGVLSPRTAQNGSVIYEDLNFSMMKSLATLKEHRGDKQNFADLLERHRDRESSGSRKKKHQ